MASRSRRAGYGRLERVNRALQEVVADELEVIDDDRLQLVTVTGVRVSPDLRHGVVFFSWLAAAGDPGSLGDVLAEHRVRLQAAVARQLRLRRTPELTFAADPAIAAGTRVEDILRGLLGEDDTSG